MPVWEPIAMLVKLLLYVFMLATLICILADFGISVGHMVDGEKVAGGLYYVSEPDYSLYIKSKIAHSIFFVVYIVTAVIGICGTVADGFIKTAIFGLATAAVFAARFLLVIIGDRYREPNYDRDMPDITRTNNNYLYHMPSEIACFIFYPLTALLALASAGLSWRNNRHYEEAEKEDY